MRLSYQSQFGQALVESLVISSLLILCLVGFSLLGRYQSIALRSWDAERLGLFTLIRQPTDQQVVTNIVTGYLNQNDRFGWKNRAQAPLLIDSDTAVSRFSNDRVFQPVLVQQLQSEWNIPQHIEELTVYASIQATPIGVKDAVLKNHTDDWRVTLSRQGGISVGAGHAYSDQHMDEQIGGASLAWRQVSDRSVFDGQRLTEFMKGVDQAWSRPLPTFDWLSPWEGQQP